MIDWIIDRSARSRKSKTTKDAASREADLDAPSRKRRPEENEGNVFDVQNTEIVESQKLSIIDNKCLKISKIKTKN